MQYFISFTVRLMVLAAFLFLSACSDSGESDDSDFLFALPLLLIDNRAAIEVDTAQAELQLGTIIGNCSIPSGDQCGDYGTGFDPATAAADCALVTGSTYTNGAACTTTNRTGTCVIVGAGFASLNQPGKNVAFRTFNGFDTVSARTSCTVDILRRSTAATAFFAAN